MEVIQRLPMDQTVILCTKSKVQIQELFNKFTVSKNQMNNCVCVGLRQKCCSFRNFGLKSYSYRQKHRVLLSVLILQKLTFEASGLLYQRSFLAAALAVKEFTSCFAALSSTKIFNQLGLRIYQRCDFVTLLCCSSRTQALDKLLLARNVHLQ